MNPYEELANAIIEQAVKDFRIALVGNLRYPSNKEHIKNLISTLIQKTGIIRLMEKL